MNSHKAPTDFLEEIYRFDGALADWTRRVAEGVQAFIDRGLGAWACVYELTEQGEVAFVAMECVGRSAGLEEALEASCRARPPRPGEPVVDTLRISVERRRARDTATRLGIIPSLGAVDTLRVGVTDPEGFGLAFGAPVGSSVRLSRRETRVLARVLGHLHTALRARRRLEKRGAERRAPGDQRLVGAAERDAANAREPMRRVVVAIDRLRGSVHAASPESVLEAWEAMLAGRWVLVDRFESGGRRFLVARPSTRGAGAPTSLSPVETVCALRVAMGCSSKLIAYELGLAESTVSTHLRSAMRKLHIRSRVELASLLSR